MLDLLANKAAAAAQKLLQAQKNQIITAAIHAVATLVDNELGVKDLKVSKAGISFMYEGWTVKLSPTGAKSVSYLAKKGKVSIDGTAPIGGVIEKLKKAISKAK